MQLAEGIELALARQGPPGRHRVGFRQEADHQGQVHNRKAHGRPDRQGDAVAGKQTAEGGPKNEAQAKGHAEQPKGLSPVLRG